MPIYCPVSFIPMSREEFAALDFAVMAHFFDTVKDLGRLADESIYQHDVCSRLQKAGFQVQGEVPVTVCFRTFSKTFYLDLAVSLQAVYEIKTVAKLTDEHRVQLLNYLLMLDLRHGKLVNLRPTSVESRFENAPLSVDERRAFTIDSRDWAGDSGVMAWIIEMLRDWGTGLELPLYHQALVHLLGGETNVIKQLPMHRGHISLGNQRFHLMDDASAFRLTAFTASAEPYRQQLIRLLKHSPLKAIHWINIAHGRVTFTTVAG